MLFGNEPNPGREVTSRSESTGVSNPRDQGGRQHRTDPGNVMKALARLVGPVPGHNHPIERLTLQCKARRHSRKPGIAGEVFKPELSYSVAVVAYLLRRSLLSHL